MQLDETNAEPEIESKPNLAEKLATEGLFGEVAGGEDSIKVRMEKIIPKLGATRPEDRENASAELKEIGTAALPYLRPALTNKDFEISIRAENFVSGLLRENKLPAMSYKKWELGLNPISETRNIARNLEMNPAARNKRIETLTRLQDCLEAAPKFCKDNNIDLGDMSRQIDELKNPERVKTSLALFRDLDLFADDNTAQITDEDLAILKHMTGLQTLDLREAPQATAVGLDNLRGLKNLESVKITEAQAFNIVVEDLAASNHLRELNLGRTKITDSAIRQIAEKFPELTNLSVYGDRITDQAISALPKLTQLQSLSLAETDITDASINNLAKLQSLDKLYLTGTKFTKEGVQRLREKLPNCEIYFEPIAAQFR